MCSLLINNCGRFEILSGVEDPSLWERYALSTGKLLRLFGVWYWLHLYTILGSTDLNDRGSTLLRNVGKY